jgi:hypothetical protein
MPTDLHGGLSKIIERSFLSLFEGINASTQAWLESTKLLALGRNRYADYMANAVGISPLFATSRSVIVDETYVRVNVTTEIERERYKSPAAIQAAMHFQKRGGGRETNIALLPFDAIEKSRGAFALLGLAGSGKTTAFRHIAVQLAKGRELLGRRRLPLFFAARDLRRTGATLRDAAVSLFREFGISYPAEVIDRLLEAGQLVFLLDGLDETTAEHQRTLTDELNRLRGINPENCYCISSRPENLSIGLPGFTKWETLPLSLDDRYKFVEKWFSAVNPGKGETLLDSCRDQPEILDIGSSPLLLSIVCALYNNDLDVPNDRDELYARAVHGLLGGWDAFRNIARSSSLKDLSIERRKLIVQWLAYYLFREGLIVFSTQQVANLLPWELLKDVFRDQVPAPRQLLVDLYNDFGLLVERSPGTYSFSHLTLQEYLVAEHIVQNRSERVDLGSFAANEHWLAVFQLVARRLPREPASMFMMDLVQRFDLLNINIANLIISAWQAGPLVTASTRKRILEILAEGLRGIFPPNSYRVAIDENGLRRAVLPLSDPIKQLIRYVKFLHSQGFLPGDLGCQNHNLICEIWPPKELLAE